MHNDRRITLDSHNYLSHLDDIVNKAFGSLSFPLVPRKNNYPPLNITNYYEQGEENDGDSPELYYDIEIALAGFKREDIDIDLSSVNQHGASYKKIEINAEKTDKSSDKTYHQQGIAERTIHQHILVAHDDEIESAKYEDGILTIKIHKATPQLKSTSIEIT